MQLCIVSLIMFAVLQYEGLANQQSSDNEGKFYLDVMQKFEEIGTENGKVLEQLSDTVQQLQVKLSKMEQALDKSLFGMRLLLASSAQFSARSLGEMLLSAVRKDDAHQVFLLLEFGANIEFEDGRKNRPIHVAVLHKRPQMLEVLLENKADVESRGEHQKTALHLAAYAKCLECANILVGKGANLESLDQWRNVPIIHAARIGFNEFLELLLQKGAKVNAASVGGWTALHHAALEGPLSTVKILLENGANVELKNEDGETPLDIAHRRRRYLIADHLQRFNSLESLKNWQFLL